MELHIQALVAGEPTIRRIEHWYIYLLGQVLERSLIRLLLMHVEVGQTGLSNSSVPEDNRLERLIVCDHSIYQNRPGCYLNILITELLLLRGSLIAERGALGSGKPNITLTLYLTSKFDAYIEVARCGRVFILDVKARGRSCIFPSTKRPRHLLYIDLQFV